MKIKDMNIFKATKVAMMILLCGAAVHVFADNEPASKKEYTPEEQQELWRQPDFVRAYYVVVEPGGAMYSVFGHAALHMVCETYGYDCCFTYESDDVASKFLTFLSGNLRMGMRRIQMDEYLEEFAKEGRGVKEYELNLPIDVKRELWRVLDERVAEGMGLSFDFESRGCAYACVLMLNEALGDKKIEYADWSPRFKRTRREMCIDLAKREYPWDVMIMSTVVGVNVDKNQKPEEKLVIPSEVAEVWKEAKVDGKYLLTREAHELLPNMKHHSTQWFTPTIVALLLLLLAIIALFIEKPWIDWLVLTIVTLIGMLETYLVVFSTLPCTNWNWLIVPFNVLPAICWKWRKYWALPYAIIVGVWAAVMIAWPHTLVDTSVIVLSIAFLMILLNKRNRMQLNLNK